MDPVLKNLPYKEEILLNELMKSTKFTLNRGISFLSAIDENIIRIRDSIMQGEGVEDRKRGFFYILELFQRNLENIRKIKACHDEKRQDLSCSCRKPSHECINKMQKKQLERSHKDSLDCCRDNTFLIMEKMLVNNESKINKWSDFGIDKVVFSWGKEKLFHARGVIRSSIKIAKTFLQNKDSDHFTVILENFEMHAILMEMFYKEGNFNYHFSILMQWCKGFIKKRKNISDQACYAKLVKKSLKIILYLICRLKLEGNFLGFVELLQLAEDKFDDLEEAFIQDLLSIYRHPDVMDSRAMRLFSFLRAFFSYRYGDILLQKEDTEGMKWISIAVFKTYLLEICGFIKLKNYSSALKSVNEMASFATKGFKGNFSENYGGVFLEDTFVFDCCLYIFIQSDSFDKKNIFSAIFNNVFPEDYLGRILLLKNKQSLANKGIREKKERSLHILPFTEENAGLGCLPVLKKKIEQEEGSIEEVENPELGYMMSFLKKEEEVSTLIDIFDGYADFYQSLFWKALKETHLLSKPLSKWQEKDIVKFVSCLSSERVFIPEDVTEIMRNFIQYRQIRYKGDHIIYQSEFEGLAIKDGGVLVRSSHIYLALFPVVLEVFREECPFLKDALIRLSEKSQNENEKRGNLVVKKVQNDILKIKLRKYRIYSCSYMFIKGKKVYLFDEVRPKKHDNRPSIQNKTLREVDQTSFFKTSSFCSKRSLRLESLIFVDHNH